MNEKTHSSPAAQSTAEPQFVAGQECGASAGMPLFLQPKLAISQPDDPYEQEADRVADQVMRMPVPTIQRQCAACEEEESVTVSRKAEGAVAGEAPRSVHATLRSPGQPLTTSTRAFFEPRFGRDLSQVRVHTDGEAQQSARDVNALAYTVGSHVVFSGGRYAPGTPDGQRLLAHELTHVAQQGCSAGFLARQIAGTSPVAVPIWHPGISHGHTPTRRWADVQADAGTACVAIAASMGIAGPTIGGAVDASIACACATMSPAQVLAFARRTALSESPLGQAHLDHYLTGGGVNLAEDLGDVIRRDAGVRGVLAGAIARSSIGFVTITQGNYVEEDFQNAFGAIDRMDYEVDTAAGTVHVWFQDRYEWHPVGYGYSLQPGDGLRGTNCVHAAAVEMQLSGAQDYWMFGNATVPLSLITGVTGTSAGSGIGTTL